MLLFWNKCIMHIIPYTFKKVQKLTFVTFLGRIYSRFFYIRNLEVLVKTGFAYNFEEIVLSR
tara:strand:+ start:294 stop:479 length:186 start_codon:yes stop_codon:yes gene_type:complete